MAGFLDNISAMFKRGDILIRFIFINVGIFLILTVLNLISTLFKLPQLDILPYLGASSDPGELLTHIWTLITYMFVQYDFFHILFNMIILYVFGRIFLSYFNGKQLGGLYFMGGIAGVLLYLLAFNTVPFYLDLNPSYLIGASASVTAILFAAAVYRPNLEIRVFFFPVKIIYVAIVIFILDFAALGSPSNPGGHIAHIGGALVGYLFARQYLKGKDITRWINNIIDFVVNLFNRKPGRMKVKYTRPKTDKEYNRDKHQNDQEIDRILDKIKESGYSGLSGEEKKRLFDASKK